MESASAAPAATIKAATCVLFAYHEMGFACMKALIKIGAPINVRLYAAEYGERRTRKEAILRLVRDLQTSIQSMLDALNAEPDAGGPP